MGRTMVERRRRASQACCRDAPQNTTDTNVLNTHPAPYTQHTAGNEYNTTCARRMGSQILKGTHVKWYWSNLLYR